jgi:hypothetical protein
MTRAALLVRCNADEADRIRFEAHREHRTISAYVLLISVRAVAKDDRLFSTPEYGPTNESLSKPPRTSGPRTAILVRCAVTEAGRIRKAARRRDIRINAFILRALKSVWDQQLPLRVGVEPPLEAHLQ